MNRMWAILVCLLVWHATGCAIGDQMAGKQQEGASWYCETLEEGIDFEDFDWRFNRDILPYKYGYVASVPTFVYGEPYDDIAGKRPKRVLGKGFIWVSLERDDPIRSGNITWYEINPGEYVLEKDLRFFEPSKFKGRAVAECDLSAISFGWIVLEVVPSRAPGEPEDPKGEYLEKHHLVHIYETRKVGQWNWYRIGPDQWVEQRRIAKVVLQKRPEKVGPEEKWIDVNLYEQTLVAYEGDRPVYATLISSGLPDFDTEEGLFRIWIKKRMAKMSGGEEEDYYFLEDVPYHMYFNNGTAIHGAYWHDNFGIRQSHGCVNVSPRDAAWLFDWTCPKPLRPEDADKWIRASLKNPGTWVWVH